VRPNISLAPTPTARILFSVKSTATTDGSSKNHSFTGEKNQRIAGPEIYPHFFNKHISISY
ncbi:hypothetical protein AMJ50_02335, partial [Parcubacteria bacterium DG_74_3]